MRRILMIFIFLSVLVIPAGATEFSAPPAPEEARRFLPDETDNFGEGLWFVITSALDTLQPNLAEAIRTCISLVLASIVVGMISDISSDVKPVTSMIGAVTIAVILLRPSRSFIQLGIETVRKISQYGKLLLPVMTGAMAAQGAITASGALFTATAIFDALLSTVISELLAPMLSVYLSLSAVCNLFSQQLLLQIQKFIKWLITWGLKTVLYVFTGYIGITGIVSGATDAALLKATKLTISGTVPVVGSILSDASEAVLVGAGIMKNAVGIYGLLAVVALEIGPFLQLGVQYLMLKLSSGIIEMFGTKQMASVAGDFSSAMGMVLAMTGTVCLLFLISTVCFMKGVS